MLPAWIGRWRSAAVRFQVDQDDVPMDTITLLLVEDEWVILEALTTSLQSAGFDVAAAADGNKAMQILREQADRIAGVITDIRLPGNLDGWAVAQRARELKPSMPIVYMTGDSAADWPSKGVPNTIIVQKPFAEAQIVAAISTLLNKAESYS